MANDLGRQALVDALRANNPQLVTGIFCNQTVAAKNIRTQLKAAFPGVKFKVQSQSYSMGCSVNIYWTDGPTAEQVEAITDQYAYGKFDGMDDSYTYNQSLWVEAFGGAKYVFANRDYSDQRKQETLDAIIEQYELNYTPEEYAVGNQWRIQLLNGRNLAEEIRFRMRGIDYGAVEQQTN